MINVRSIRFQLTVWYVLVFTFGLAMLQLATWSILRQSMMNNRTSSLDSRLTALALFVEQESHGNEIADIQEELREYATGLPPEHLLRATDAQGQVVFERKTSEGELLVRDSEVQILGHTILLELGAPLDDYYRTLATLRAIMLGSLPLVVLFAFGGGWLLARRALAPIDSMTQSAMALDTSRLGSSLPVPKTGDEVQRLAESWNMLLSRIDESRRSLHQFTGDAAHELRTPVAVLRTSAELALRQPRSAGSYRQTLQSIEREAIAVSAMLDQLLFLARAEDGKLAFHFTEVDFSAIVREVSDGFLPVASDHAVQLGCEFPPCEVPVVGDALALRRLATNLLDNAVKFTPAGGRVTVTLGLEKSEAHLTVKDTGCGIPSDDLRKIFRRFYRVDAAKTAGMGSGLGLAIVESVAAAHQGNLSVASKPGEGSAFTFRMSVTASKRPASQPEVAATVTH